jgi:hypothetical protein
VLGAERPDHDDRTWSVVHLPHNTRFNSPEDIAEYLGVSWYRRHFDTDPRWADRLTSIRFEGVMQRADVWVNGIHVASHVGGYTPFVIDVTDVLEPRGVNVIAVRADSRPDRRWAPGKTGVDFRYFGGIYRTVTVTATDRVHVTDAVAAGEVAGGGVFITTPIVERDSALVQVRTHIANDHPCEHAVEAVVDVIDADGRTVASHLQTLRVAANSATTAHATLTVGDPRLWHPHHPSLYTARVLLRVGGETVDDVAERFGIRHISWTHQGLFVNGERFRAIGVNRHQEIYGLGNASPISAIRNDVARVKGAGFDFIRTSHYPNDPAFYRACDELGILVLNSMTGWQTFFATDAFIESTRRELRTMIRRDRNHPSVVAWETSLNETEYPRDWAEGVHALAHEEYPGDQMFTAGWKDHFDILVVASQHGARETASTKPIIISEWGDWDHGGNTSSSRVPRESYDLPIDGRDNLQQVDNHRRGLDANLSMPWFTADGLWDFADMSGYNSTASLMGVVDYFRIPKFSYFFFRSQRDPDVHVGGTPVGAIVFIANTWSADSPTRVSVYSNAQRVRLFKNDRLVADRAPDGGPHNASLPHPPFTFEAGPFEPGELRAEALIDGVVVATATRSTAGEATTIRLRPESALPLRADGADARLVFIDVTDAAGTVSYADTSTVELSIDGPGELVGPTFVRMKGGQLAAWVRAGRVPGTITLTAVAPGLVADSVRIGSEGAAGLPQPRYEARSTTRVDLVAGARVVASSTTETPPGTVVNGYAAFEWRPHRDDREPWLAVDLGGAHDITGSTLTFDGDGSRCYRLEVSDDGVVWRPVSGRSPESAESTLRHLQWFATARRVRAVFAGSDEGLAVTGFAIHGHIASQPAAVDVAQEKAEVTASSAAADHGAAMGNNGNPAEFWQAADPGEASWLVDLGGAFVIDCTVVTWIPSSGSHGYRIDVSLDGCRYRTVATHAGSGSWTPETEDSLQVEARFLRMTIDPGAQLVPVGFYSFKALGSSARNAARSD